MPTTGIGFGWLVGAGAAAVALVRFLHLSKTLSLLLTIPLALVLVAVLPSDGGEPTKRIAIVEDDPSFQMLWQERLIDRLPGVQVDVFPSGELLIAAGFNYNLFIVDHHLAGKIEGPELIWLIRHGNPGAVIVFFPGNAYQIEKGVRVGVLAIEMGANLVFEKTDSMTAALKVILALLGW